MKKLTVIVVTILVVVIAGCSSGPKREPGLVYMPDMAYSRAYETYAPIDTLASQGIYYNRKPVPGTIKRGEMFPFSLEIDQPGDTTNYVAAKQVTNPLPPLNEVQTKEAERLYLVNCGICHGTALDGNGPLYDGGNGPYLAAPAQLIGNPTYESKTEGQMFYVMTYGKGQMGSYASQLSTTQRWMVAHFIKDRQKAAKGASTADDSSTANGTADSTATNQ